MQILLLVANLTISRLFFSPGNCSKRKRRWRLENLPSIEYSYSLSAPRQIILFLPWSPTAATRRRSRRVLNEISVLAKRRRLLATLAFETVCTYPFLSDKSRCEKAEAGSHASRTFVNTLFDETVQLLC